MKKLVIILGFISAILAIVLAVTPLFKIAFVPGIAALLFGILAIYLSKQDSKKSIQLIFLLTIIALSLTTYKSVFDTVEVGNTDELQEKETESQEDAINELEGIELDESDFE
ncbi:FUSC family protein [Psychroserpens sp.]|uniref:FUSC family protein n=1 Tax=Psychroserpens sp. TaxID=2020870 RepID=UPI002B278A37|nr:FUSC family protein [Psychroserpens sp.]